MKNISFLKRFLFKKRFKKEREGFEPSMVLLPYRRSRSIPSTSRTPFPDKAKKVIQIKALAK